MPSRPKVFISYRREDTSGQAGRLFDQLAARLGRERVFRDVDHIAPGEDFVDAVRRRIAESDLVLVLIGRQWLNATDAEGQLRLHAPDDLVHFEVATALGRGVPVIPVLLAGAGMPGAKDLPPGIQGLARRNAIEVRDAYFDHDSALLMERVAPRRRVWLTLSRRTRLLLAGAVLVMSLSAAFFFHRYTSTAAYAIQRLRVSGAEFDAPSFIEYASRGDTEMVGLYLQAGMDPDASYPNGEDTAVNKAAEEGHLAVVRMLVERGALTPLALGYAVRANKSDVIDYLLTRNPKERALAFAMEEAAQNNLPALERLVVSGVKPDLAWGGTPLRSAASAGKLEAVKFLLARGAQVNAGDGERGTALHAAAAQSSLDIVQELVEHGANVNARSESGETPLMNAITSDSVRKMEIVAFLLSKHADVNAATKNGNTALMRAVYRDTEIVNLLVQMGADVNAQDQEGHTALMHAAGYGDSVDRPETLKLLVSKGARIDAVTGQGWTALMFAAERGLVENGRILLAHRANRNLLNKDGDGALAIARKNHQTKFEQLLTQ